MEGGGGGGLGDLSEVIINGVNSLKAVYNPRHFFRLNKILHGSNH